MNPFYERTSIVLGEEAIETLKQSTVCVFGVGGVGGFLVEALARSGVGHLIIVDHDDVDATNLNRQIIATSDVIGEDKVELFQKRIALINPDCQVEVKKTFYLPENKDQFDFASYDFVADAIDTIKAKISIIEECQKVKTPIISCMGMGNKIDPSYIRIDDIYKTKVDPLAKVMRHELKKRRVAKCPVCFSLEKPQAPHYSKEHLETLAAMQESGSKRRAIPGSVSFVPSVAGLMMAGYIVRKLTHSVAYGGV